jgi:hypothetical protein
MEPLLHSPFDSGRAAQSALLSVLAAAAAIAAPKCASAAIPADDAPASPDEPTSDADVQLPAAAAAAADAETTAPKREKDSTKDGERILFADVPDDPPETRPFARIGLWSMARLARQPGELAAVQMLALDWQWATNTLIEHTSADDQRYIRGGGLQVPVPPTHHLYAATEQHMRRGLAYALGLDQLRLRLGNMLQLVARPGEGGQPLHADLPLDTESDRAFAARCYSALFFPKSCESTILPTLSAIQHDRALVCTREQQRLLKPIHFFTVHIRAGTLILLRGDVFHAAPKNFEATTRVAIYAMFVPANEFERGVRNFNLSSFPFGTDRPFELPQHRQPQRKQRRK